MTRSGRAALAAALAFALAMLAHREARADAADVRGALDARLLVGVTERVGGLVAADLWGKRGRWAFGGGAGVGALSKAGRTSSRVVTPFTLSIAILPPDDQSGPTACVRGGLYAGAKKGGFIVGPSASVALGYRFALGEGASVRLGLDAWGLFLNHGGVFIGPYLGLGF